MGDETSAHHGAHGRQLVMTTLCVYERERERERGYVRQATVSGDGRERCFADEEGKRVFSSFRRALARGPCVVRRVQLLRYWHEKTIAHAIAIRRSSVPRFTCTVFRALTMDEVAYAASRFP